MVKLNMFKNLIELKNRSRKKVIKHLDVSLSSLTITKKRNLDNLLNDTGRSSADIDKQQNIIVYYTPSGATSPSEAVPHSLSWSKESRLTASCFPDILPTDRNGHSQVILVLRLICAHAFTFSATENSSNRMVSTAAGGLDTTAGHVDELICQTRQNGLG